MLLKITCESPKTTLPLSLLFDDGTTKKVDLTEGMYATFVYMLHGVSTEFTGKVKSIYTSSMKINPAPPVKDPGYLCDPNYVNSGVIHPTPIRPHYHPHYCRAIDVDVRNYIEVEGAGKDIGNTVKIDIYSITNIFTIHSDAEPVLSPDDSTAVKMLRCIDGVLQYSTDAITWNALPVNAEDIAKLTELYNELSSDKASNLRVTTIQRSLDELSSEAAKADELSQLSNVVDQLMEQVNTLKAEVDSLKSV